MSQAAATRSDERVQQLSYRAILAFWFPLGMMWLMMAAEQPALAAVIARLPGPELNLAAYGVVWAIALVIESPIIQMLAAATAVADSEANYRLLLRFMHVLGAALTVIHLVIGLTPLYDLLVSGVLNVPADVAEASRLPFVIMAPFAAAVGYRRLWQGTLIRHGKTWIVPITMLSRLLLIGTVLAIGLVSERLEGAMLASTALIAGVVIAAVAAGVLNRRLVVPILKAAPERERHTWRTLFHFYAPLSLTTVVFLLSQPMVTFGIARGIEPTRSLAVFPVINGFHFLFASIGLSYQETAIALLGRSPRSLPRLSRFTAILAVSVSGLMLLTGLTPIGNWWFRVVSGLGESLLPLTPVPLLIMSIIPLLVTYKAWYRARYVASGRTNVLAQAVVAYTVVLFAAVLAGSSLLPLVAVTVAAIALAVAQAMENGYLLLRLPKKGTPAAS